MALEVASLTLKLGGLGLRKLSEQEEMLFVMKYGLSFIVDEDIVDGLFDMISGNSELIKQMESVSKKVDLLLDEASVSSMQLLRDAYTAFDAQNYDESIQMFKEVGENARKAFNLSDNIDAWVASTQLRITDTFMRKSFEDGRFKSYGQLSVNRRKEIAANIRDRVEDLVAKAEKERKTKVQKGMKALINKSGRMKEARKDVKDINAKVNQVLRRAYPILTHGLGWTNPESRVSVTSKDFQFDVFPKYIPEGKENEVSIVISRRPEIVVSLYRRLDFAYDRLELSQDTQFLEWVLNGTVHQKIIGSGNADEPVPLKIERPELDIVFRGRSDFGSTVRRMTVGPAEVPDPTKLQKNHHPTTTAALAKAESFSGSGGGKESAKQKTGDKGRGEKGEWSRV